jgi:hypothetical protein
MKGYFRLIAMVETEGKRQGIDGRKYWEGKSSIHSLGFILPLVRSGTQGKWDVIPALRKYVI